MSIALATETAKRTITNPQKIGIIFGAGIPFATKMSWYWKNEKEDLLWGMGRTIGIIDFEGNFKLPPFSLDHSIRAVTGREATFNPTTNVGKMFLGAGVAIEICKALGVPVPYVGQYSGAAIQFGLTTLAAAAALAFVDPEEVGAGAMTRGETTTGQTAPASSPIRYPSRAGIVTGGGGKPMAGVK